MQFVPGNNIEQGVYRYPVTTCQAKALFFFGIKAFKKTHIGLSRQLKLFGKVGQFKLAMARVGYVIILIKASSWGIISTGKTQGPVSHYTFGRFSRKSQRTVGKHPFGIAHVA